MNTLATEPTVSGGDREMVLTRVYDAPPRRVWEAFTDPKQIVKWYGPRGFTMTIHAHEVRAGGVWRFTFHGPDGRDYENKVTYLEVDPPNRLRYKHGGADDVEPVNHDVTATFEAVEGGKTRLTFTMVFVSAEAKQLVVREYGAIEGGKQTLTRLAEFLADGNGGKDNEGEPFVLERVVRSPRERVYRAWTKREELAKWFGPKGATISTCTLELRPGGMFHYCMHAGEMTMWGRWVFREIVENERIVCVSSFSDEGGGVTGSPFGGEWPREILMRVTFAEHAGIGRGTLVRLEWTPLNASDAERAAFKQMHGSMNQGWGGTFERLEMYLKKG